MSDGQKQLLTIAFILGVAVLLCAGLVVGAVQLTGGVAELVNPSLPPPALDDGVLITAVLPESPAAQANLQPGHILLRLNDDPITSPELLTLLLQQLSAGETFTLLVRDEAGELRQTTAVRAGAPPYLGVEITDLPRQTPIPAAPNPTPTQTSPSVTQLPVVTAIVPDSPAAKVDVQVGDIVTAVNGQAILSSAELLTQMATKSLGESVTFTLRRGEETLLRTAVLAPHPDNAQSGFLGIEFQP
jgi:S1-C subfamily serine protease